ncbi:MAG: endolytic transglycosylase MltG [Candidatus Paceibacterota bacterium]
MFKKNLKIILAVVLLVLLFLLKSVLNSQIGLTKQKFIINPGDNFLLIADNLYKQGVIKNKNLFIVFAYLNGDYSRIKPGEYIFDGKYNISQIMDLLKNNLGISITIPEGFNIFQVENELLKNGIITEKFSLANYQIKNLKDSFDIYPFLQYIDEDNNFEGFLYPNTYYFLKNTEVKDVVLMFLDNFNTEIYNQVKQNIGEKDVYEKLILASLVEKETYFKNDISQITSVIRNRIKKDMPLQIDATLCYIKMQNNYFHGKAIDCGSLTNVDKNLESPYNTYINKGMILLPICSVNFETYNAVLKNVDTDYLYYISDPQTKNTIFAKTLEEHNENIKKYLK